MTVAEQILVSVAPAPLQAALEYAKRGWAVFPLHSVRNGLCSCEALDCDAVAKHPRTKRGLTEASLDPAQIHWWWVKWPDANVGVATGRSIAVIDIDPRSGGLEALTSLTTSHGQMPNTLEVITGGADRGRHLYFSIDDRPLRGLNGLAPGIDLKADGGYVIAPPSVHKSGLKYEWGPDVPLAPLPDWVRILRDKPRERVQTITTGSGGSILHGQRNATLASIAGSMRRRGMDQEAIAAGLLEDNRRRCNPPLAEDEVRGIASSVARYEPAQRDFALTDFGNAERLVARHGDDLRYCSVMREWYVWDGQRWRADDTGEVERRVKETARAIYGEAEAASDPVRRRDLAAHAVKSESAAKLASAMDLAQSEAKIALRVSELDTDPWALNVANGTLDLRTGKLRPHDRADLITKITPTEYDPEAKCPTWLAFLDRVLAGDAALIAFIRRAFGYALTGQTTEQKLFLLYGTGANGKSTLVELMRALLADYATAADSTTFVAQRGDSIRNDIARLRGARLVTAVEMEAGRALAEVQVKQLTGGDTVTARKLYAEFFEFKPTFKLVLAANHKPTIRGTDHAIWRRICLVPFKTTIPAGEQDPQLGAKLRAELPGILAWSVQGCLEWQVHGLEAPAAVLAATESYREEMDSLGDFLGERCAVEPEASVSAKAIYAAYTEWAATAGEKPMAQNAFGMRLAERGFERGRGQRSSTRERHWRGIRLTEAEPLGLS